MAAVLEKAQKSAMKKPTLTVGKIIDSLWELREKKRELAAHEKDLNGQIDALEAQLFERMDAEDTVKSTGKKASVSLGTTTVYDISDFDELSKYVKKTGYFHLFQRRVSAAAVGELFEQGKAVPGISPFTKRKVNLTTLK